jgi:hypothetical protein
MTVPLLRPRRLPRAAPFGAADSSSFLSQSHPPLPRLLLRAASLPRLLLSAAVFSFAA